MINEYQRNASRSNRPYSSNSDRYSKQPSHRSVNFNENDKNNDLNDVDEYKGSNSVYKSSQDNNYDMNKDKLDSASIYQQQQQQHHAPAQSQREQIQVQILPQDDNWGENQTEFSFNDDMTEDGRSGHFNARSNGGLLYSKENEIDIENQNYSNKSNHQGCFRMIRFYISHYFGFICSLLISTISFATPILFIILPRLNINQDWQVGECGLECEGLLIGIAFKLSILLLGNWAVFRRPQSMLPRIYELRTLLVFLLFIMTFSFWLFYGVRIIETKAQDYHKILQFTVSYVDVLLFIFVITIFILEIRHLKPQFVVKIVRSPDGQQEEVYLLNFKTLTIIIQYIKENFVICIRL
jgi:vang-like